MQARASADEHRDARRDTSTKSKLDDRYGKIGIRAVAGAACCKGEGHKAKSVRRVPKESD
ncbi:MAG TPA: hypothetical protein VHD59_05460 [Pseudolabrys sp.]|jgi:hypothetical protein|nr:hypothetical protein [Pseudolabrys sp.]